MQPYGYGHNYNRRTDRYLPTFIQSPKPIATEPEDTHIDLFPMQQCSARLDRRIGE